MLHIAGIPQLPQTQEKHPYLSPESLAGAGNSSSSTLYSSTPSILMPRGHLLPTEVNVRQLQRLITKTWDLARRSHQIVPAVKNADFNNKPDLIAHMSSRLQEAWITPVHAGPPATTPASVANPFPAEPIPVPPRALRTLAARLTDTVPGRTHRLLT